MILRKFTIHTFISFGMILVFASACRSTKHVTQHSEFDAAHFYSSTVCERGTLTVIRPHVQLPDILTSQVIGEAPRETLKVIYANYRDSIVYDTINVEVEDTTCSIKSTAPPTPVSITDLKIIISVCLFVCSLILFLSQKFGRK